jgi:hypothetical protein
MFDPAIERLREDLEIVKNVLAINEFVRHDFYLPAANNSDRWIELRKCDPSKIEWQIFDHCAIFTRLYSIFEQFVDDLASEYLKLLPNLYDSYWDLPTAVITQHRLGVGQIMIKLGKEGPYRGIEEEVLVRQVSSGIRGEQPYVIVSEAFFIDRQNYRFDRVLALFASLGFAGLRQRIEKDGRIRSLLVEAGIASIDSELKEFVDRRNEAAHTEVSNIVAADAVKRIADFILVFGSVLSDAVKEEIWQRSADVGWYQPVATVKETHYGGRVIVVELEEAQYRVGDEFALIKKGKAIPVVVQSIQIANCAVASVTVKKRIEVGLTLNAKATLGSHLVRIKNPFDRRVLGTPPVLPEFSIAQVATDSEMSTTEFEEEQSDDIDLVD